LLAELSEHEKECGPTPKLSNRQLAWYPLVPEIEQGLREGKGYELSTIRDALNEILASSDAPVSLHNKDVKLLVINQFKDGIAFSYPDS
jgi:hypothetical protein